MEVKELALDENGLETYFELNGEQVKLTKLNDIKELNKAHSYIAAVICEQFFEMAKMYADEHNIELNEVFESQAHMDNAFKSYISDFMQLLIKNAVMHSQANYALFKRQRENAKNHKCDA